MTDKHTPGKLMIPAANVFRIVAVDDLGDPIRLILDGCPDGHYGAIRLRWGDDDGPEMAANARRLAAAWNACDGISTEALEAGVVKALLAACKAAQLEGHWLSFGTRQKVEAALSLIEAPQ